MSTKEEQKQHLADIMNTPLGQEVEHSDQVEETLEEIKNPIGDFIFKNAVSTLCFDGAYYHYSEVCKLLRLQEERMYSEEEVNFIIAEVWNSYEDNEDDETFTQMRKRVLDQFKKQ